MRGSSACTPSPTATPGLPGARQSLGFSCCPLASALLLVRMRSCGTGPFTAESHMVRAQHPPSLHAHFMAVLGVLPDRFTAGGGGKEAAALPEGLGGASLGLGSFPHVSTFEGSRGLEAGDTGGAATERGRAGTPAGPWPGVCAGGPGGGGRKGVGRRAGPSRGGTAVGPGAMGEAAGWAASVTRDRPRPGWHKSFQVRHAQHVAGLTESGPPSKFKEPRGAEF